MLDILTKTKKIEDQSPAEKMAMLKMVAHQWLGKKWDLFRKIKYADQGFSFFKETNLLEQMKATQSALKFTSRNTANAYRSAYKNCIKDVRARTGIKQGFPDLVETEDSMKVACLSPRQDSIIIGWTPIKFLLPVKRIREKGLATQRHTEGLVAKLFFKVVAYYATGENWDVNQLTCYLRKITPESNYQEVAAQLEPLKADLLMFADVYEPFKFGSAKLGKGAVQDVDAFEDALGGESFEDQIKSLYWYNFIYQGMELFLFRYYLTLITACCNITAIKFITSIFEPALLKAIENKNVFLGSFETDRSKKKFVGPFEGFKEKIKTLPETKMIKTPKMVYQVYNYTLSLLDNHALTFDLTAKLDGGSEWANFIKYRILGFEEEVNPLTELTATETQGEEGKEAKEEKKDPRPEVNDPNYKWVMPEISESTRGYALMQIMAMMVSCNEFRRIARQKVLERFKKRVQADKEFVDSRVDEIQKKGAKKLREMEGKIRKLRRMKQEETAQVYEQDVIKFKKRMDEMCDGLREESQVELSRQKQRLQVLFQEISKENNVNPGQTSKLVLDLAHQLDKEEDFKKGFTQFIISQIQDDYVKELEPFYRNLFPILEPSTQEKQLMIKALDKSAPPDGVHLQLSDDEIAQIEATINQLKAKIMQSEPEIFKSKLIFGATVIPMEDLMKLSVDNNSMQRLLRLKATSPKSPKPTQIKPQTAKALMVLNMVTNPVPKHNLVMEGREEEMDPQRSINPGILTRLLAGI